MGLLATAVAAVGALVSAAFGGYVLLGLARTGIDPDRRGYAVFLGAGGLLAFLYAALLGRGAVVGELRPALLLAVLANVGVVGFVYTLYVD